MDDRTLLEAIRSIVQEEMSGVKEDVQTLKAKTDTLQDGMQTLKMDVAKLNHFIVPKVNALHDCIVGMDEKFSRLDRLESDVESLDHRVFALEQNA